MKFFHRHHWTTIDVRHVLFHISRGDATLVLQRCSCGAARTKTFDGHWSASQLRGLR